MMDAHLSRVGAIHILIASILWRTQPYRVMFEMFLQFWTWLVVVVLPVRIWIEYAFSKNKAEKFILYEANQTETCFHYDAQ